MQQHQLQRHPTDRDTIRFVWTAAQTGIRRVFAWQLHLTAAVPLRTLPLPYCQQAVVSIEKPEVLVRAHCMAGSCCCNSAGPRYNVHSQSG